MEELEGYVDHIIYQNESNGYTVLDLDSDGLLLGCVGNLPGVSEGEYIKAQGEYVIHPNHGRQFRIEAYEVRPPQDCEAMERYLASGAIKGIGAALAGRIVKLFGDDTFRIIEEEPERLAEVHGISLKKAQEIAVQMETKKDMRQGMMYLQQYGIPYTLSVKLYNHYGSKVHTILEENPYRLAEDIQGIGFRIADEIARKIGIGTNSDYRIRAGIFYVLQLAAGQGHMYLPYSLLIANCQEILGLHNVDIEHHIMDMVIDKKLYLKEIKKKDGKQPDSNDNPQQQGAACETEKRVYGAQNYFMELNVARMLKDLDISYDIDREEADRTISHIEDEQGIILDDIQREAVVEAVNQGVLIITGGPGTGKTTTIKTILRYFEMEGMDLLLAAPTGRAAKRMTETTGFEAQTIHRMLELSGGFEEEKRSEFGRNEQNPLEADVIIIDETSMVDIYLMNSLLRAVLPGTRIIFVGDMNQLPSVGPGCVLRDMIISEKLPVVRLQKIFRQASESDIIVNAHKINRGEMIEFNNRESKDFFFMEKNDAQQIQRTILALVKDKLPSYVNATTFDIQVLTPSRKGVLGVESLNQMLQKYLNPPSEDKKERETNGGIFREGDKVMQIKNNYQLEWEIVNQYNIPIDKGMGVFNGDVGVISYMDDGTETLQVVFDDGKKVVYTYKQLEELELAYAITIHKSQGSEYPAVVIPIASMPLPLLNRNVLYTAVTRAKSCVTILGTSYLLREMIANENESRRYSGLADCLGEL